MNDFDETVCRLLQILTSHFILLQNHKLKVYSKENQTSSDFVE